MDYLLAGTCVILVLVNAILYLRQSFYRGYFRQKQINAGKDPDTVLRGEFPVLWRVM